MILYYFTLSSYSYRGTDSRRSTAGKRSHVPNPLLAINGKMAVRPDSISDILRRTTRVRLWVHPSLWCDTHLKLLRVE
jgi:hypothetical protein